MRDAEAEPPNERGVHKLRTRKLPRPRRPIRISLQPVDKINKATPIEPHDQAIEMEREASIHPSIHLPLARKGKAAMVGWRWR